MFPGEMPGGGANRTRDGRGGAVTMGLATNHDTGLAGASAELYHLMLGGGSMQPEVARRMLEEAGFPIVKALNFNDNTVMVATCPDSVQP